MKKSHVANLLAVGVGMASITASAEAALNNVFSAQPRAINLEICEVNHLSLNNIHKMINQRNYRDFEIVRSSVDDMLHL